MNKSQHIIRPISKIPFKTVVFDLDETLGYFTEFGIFCDCLNVFFKNNKYSDINFNELLDLFPEFLRPKILYTLQYLKIKKKQNKCYKVMIYTNNQGDKKWAVHIKKYFDNMLNYNLFDQIIAAFKVKGKQIEVNRTSHDKTKNDFFRCTKLPDDIEICFIDDVYHYGMIDDNVYYINVKPYYYKLNINDMISRFLNSNLGRKIKNKKEFVIIIEDEFKKYNYSNYEKKEEEQQIDEIVSKRMLQHLKIFFLENKCKTIKYKTKKLKNKTIKKYY